MDKQTEEEELKQLEKADSLDRLELPYHKKIVQKELPYTIGGGIGQSRMCMYMLKKAHIGEVQSSYWPNEIIEKCKKENIELL